MSEIVIRLTEDQARKVQRLIANYKQAQVLSPFKEEASTLLSEYVEQITPQILDGEKPRLVWMPVSEFTADELGEHPALIIKRDIPGFLSAPRVAKFCPMLKPDSPLSGRWRDRLGKELCRQSADLTEGWATHVMIPEAPEGWRFSRLKHGYEPGE